MANALVPLSTLFHESLFRIPDYQRGYAWKKQQLVDFWEDLLNLNEARYHYTGLLSLKEINKDDSKINEKDKWLRDLNYKTYHIVDGQQRLTTISILLFEIVLFYENLDENIDKNDDEILIKFETLKNIKEKYLFRIKPPNDMHKAYMFGYEQDNPSHKYLINKVFEHDIYDNIEETYYTQNLLYAKNFFKNNIKKVSEKRGLKYIAELYSKLTKRFMFNIHYIDDDYDVFVAFETMNNRGKKLSNLELLKNRLIYLTTIFNSSQLDSIDERELRLSINESWKKIYRQLGRNKNHPLNDDELLRAHWITYFKYTRSRKDAYINFLLDKFSAKNVYNDIDISVDDEIEEINQEGTDELLDNNNDNQDLEIEKIKENKIQPKEIDDYVKSLAIFSKQWYYTFFPEESELSYDEKLWIKKLHRLGMGYFRPLIAVAISAKEQQNNERLNLLKEIERFIFLIFRMARYNSTYKNSFYYNQARLLYENKLTMQEIADEIMLSADNDINSVVSTFISRNAKRFDSDKGFYSWSGLYYLLFEYESRLSDINKIDRIDDALFTKAQGDKVSIEHILPQTPNKWYWRNQYRDYNEEEIRMLSGSLGNLMLLSHSINSSMQNDEFPEKKNPIRTNRRGYKNGSHSEIEVSQIEDWTAREILNRGIKLLDFMEDRWKIHLTDEEKIELLHIGFVNDNRPISDELPKPEYKNFASEDKTVSSKQQIKYTETSTLQFNFWDSFINYCKSIGREDLVYYRARHKSYYKTGIGNAGYQIRLQALLDGELRLVLQTFSHEGYKRLFSQKEQLEKLYGRTFDWEFSDESTKSRRIMVHTMKNNALKEEYYLENFKWFITNYDQLVYSLKTIGEEIYELRKVNSINKEQEDTASNAYNIARMVYDGELSRTEGRDRLSEAVDLNPSTASDYINIFFSMMKGERYSRTLNDISTRFYLDSILDDYGEESFSKTLNAVEKHASYYSGLGYGRLVYVDRILAEYSND